MSKENRRVKNVSGAPVSFKDREAKAIAAIEFPRAWQEARMYDSSLPPNPPKNLPEEAQRAILILAKRVLKLESEWS
jgi:hypothetical protein